MVQRPVCVSTAPLKNKKEDSKGSCIYRQVIPSGISGLGIVGCKQGRFVSPARPAKNKKKIERRRASINRSSLAGFQMGSLRSQHRTKKFRPHPGPMASQARHKMDAPSLETASRNVVPGGEGESSAAEVRGCGLRVEEDERRTSNLQVPTPKLKDLIDNGLGFWLDWNRVVRFGE